MKKMVFVLSILFVVLFQTPVLMAAEIEIWHYFADSKGMEFVVDKFNEINEDVQVKSRYIHVSELENQLTKALLMKDTPDLVILDATMIARFADIGALADISEYVNNSTIKKDLFYEEAWESGIYKEKLYAIPQNINTLAVFYNKDLFSEKNIKKLPENWEELKAAAKKISDPAKKTYGFAFSAPKNEHLTFQFAPFLWQAGATFYNLDSKKASRALSLWQEMIYNTYSPKSVLNTPQYELAINFAAGNIGMMINGPWAIGVLENADINYGVIKMPVNKAVNKPYSVLGGESIAIMSGSKEKEASWKFIEFFMQKDIISKWCKYEDRISARKDAINVKSPEMEVFIEQLDFAIKRPVHPEYTKISSAVQTAVQSALTGSNAEDSLKRAQETIGKLTK